MRRSVLALMTAVVLTIAGAMVTDAATKTPFGANLVKNPGAEAGPAGDGSSIVDVPHWNIGDSNFTVVAYGTPNFPTVAEAQRIGGGHHFFSCGAASGGGYMSQGFGLKGRSSAIDAGHIKLTVKALIATYSTQGDSGWIDVQFLSNKPSFSNPAVLIDSVETDHVSATNSMFVHVSKSKTIPTGTHYIDVVVRGLRTDGSYCDAYFDKISVSIAHT